MLLSYIFWRSGLRKQVRRGGQFIQSVAYFFYIPYVEFTHQILHYIFPKKYSDAEPFKIVSVDPNEIQLTTNDHFRYRWVVKGSWDKSATPIQKSKIAHALGQHFCEGKSWDESGYPDIVRSQINDNNNAWGCENERDIYARCASLDQLWESMTKEGYKSQHQVLKEDPKHAFDSNTDEIHPKLNEIGIDIGRDGNLLWNRLGHHRLIIAQLLNIEEVPVQIFRRHTQWQRKRDKIKNSDRKGEQIKTNQKYHPDLRDIID